MASERPPAALGESNVTSSSSEISRRTAQAHGSERGRTTRRRPNGIAAAALAVAAVIGSSGPARAETPADQLVVGFSMTNLLTLDPAAITGREAVQVLTNIYDGLVSLDPVNRRTLNPDLAQSWTVADDKRSITFKLRDGVTFASGNPLTAQDVVWSVNRTLKLNLAQATCWKANGFTADNVAQHLSAPDASTVELRLPKPTDPQVVLYTIGNVGCGSVVDSKLVQQNAKGDDLGAAWLNVNSAGSGAYTLRS